VCCSVLQCVAVTWEIPVATAWSASSSYLTTHYTTVFSSAAPARSPFAAGSPALHHMMKTSYFTHESVNRSQQVQ